MPPAQPAAPPPPLVVNTPAPRLRPSSPPSISPYVVEPPALTRPAPTFRSTRRTKSGGSGAKIALIVLALLLVGAAAWYFLMGPGAMARRLGAAAADSARAAAAADSTRLADSARAAAAAPTTGFVRVTGDLPDDAVISMAGRQQNARTFPMAPGSHTLEIESSEFEPYSRRITVRIGDTTRVFVELELKADSTQN